MMKLLVSYLNVHLPLPARTYWCCWYHETNFLPFRASNLDHFLINLFLI